MSRDASGWKRLRSLRAAVRCASGVVCKSSMARVSASISARITRSNASAWALAALAFAGVAAMGGALSARGGGGGGGCCRGASLAGSGFGGGFGAAAAGLGGGFGGDGALLGGGLGGATLPRSGGSTLPREVRGTCCGGTSGAVVCSAATMRRAATRGSLVRSKGVLSS